MTSFFSSSVTLHYWNVLFLAHRHHKYIASQNDSNWMLWKHSTNIALHFFSVSKWRNKAPVKKEQRFWRMASDQGNYDNSIIINSSLRGFGNCAGTWIVSVACKIWKKTPTFSDPKDGVLSGLTAPLMLLHSSRSSLKSSQTGVWTEQAPRYSHIQFCTSTDMHCFGSLTLQHLDIWSMIS